MIKLTIYLNNGNYLCFNGVRDIDVRNKAIRFDFEENKSAVFYLCNVAGFTEEEK